MEYGIDIKDHVKYLSEIAITVIVCSLFLIYSFFNSSGEEFYEFLLIGILVFLFFFIPQLYVHLCYYIINKAFTIEYSNGDFYFNISNANSTERINFNNIKSVDYIKTPALIENRTTLFPWEKYHYCIITLDSKKIIIITCLLISNFPLSINIEKQSFKQSLIPYIPLGIIFSKFRFK